VLSSPTIINAGYELFLIVVKASSVTLFFLKSSVSPQIFRQR